MYRIRRFLDWLVDKDERLETYTQARGASLGRAEYARMYDKPLPLKDVIERICRPSGPGGFKPSVIKQHPLDEGSLPWNPEMTSESLKGSIEKRRSE